MLAEITIRKMTKEDWPQVRKIYAEGIETGVATFETEVPEWDAWDAAHILSCRLVAHDEDQIVGWAALSPTSKREAYQGVAEASVYVASSSQRKGVGKKLLAALIHESEKEGFWTLQARIFPENVGSIALVNLCGFREVGVREKIGKHQGAWRDVVLLERRSPKFS